MAKYITDDGEFLIESVSTVDKGQWITVKRWAKKAHVWIHVTDLRPPRYLPNGRLASFNEQVTWTVRALHEIIGSRQFTECDPPAHEWEADAMNSKG